MHAIVNVKSYNFMKLQNQNLAERLAAAAATPLPLPPAVSATATVSPTAAVPSETIAITLRGRPRIETVQMTIRPSRFLRERLDQIAIQRAVSEMRMVTAQEIAIEILESALRVDTEHA